MAATPSPTDAPSPLLETFDVAYASPWNRGFWWAREATAAGTPPALSAATWHDELLVGWDDSDQRGEYTVPALGRFPVMSYGQDEIQHHTEPTLHTYYVSDGLAPDVMATLLGDNANTGTVETPGGSSPNFTHSIVPGVKSTRQVTYALLKDTAPLSGNPCEQYSYVTPQSITLNLPSTDTPILCDIPMMSRWKTTTTRPTAATTVANNDRRMRGNQGTFHIKSSAGIDYTALILTGTIMIGREASEPVFTIARNQKDVATFVPGRLQLAITLTMMYDNQAAGSVEDDFLNDLSTGTTGSPHTISYTDGGGNGFSLSFYPAKWAIPTWDISGNSTKLTAVLNAYQDPTNRTTLTLLQNLTITNASATALVA